MSRATRNRGRHDPVALRSDSRPANANNNSGPKDKNNSNNDLGPAAQAVAAPETVPEIGTLMNVTQTAASQETLHLSENVNDATIVAADAEAEQRLDILERTVLGIVPAFMVFDEATLKAEEVWLAATKHIKEKYKSYRDLFTEWTVVLNIYKDTFVLASENQKLRHRRHSRSV